MQTMIHITPESRNAKTGPIPVTTTSENSCPDVCPMKAGAGCYAKSGPLAMHWKKVSKGERGGSWGDLLDFVRGLPEGQLWRHNQAGDLPHTGGEIDREAIAQLATANMDRKGFTYTHHDMGKAGNRLAVRAMNEAGFTVNLSANNLSHADELAALGIAPVVTILPETQTENTTTPEGRRVVVCPAAIRDGVSCATCQLCQRADRKVIVGFPAHGTQKRAASALASIPVAVEQ